MNDSTATVPNHSGVDIHEVGRSHKARVSGSFVEITSDVACVPLALVNVYLIGPAGATDRSWVLIDAGVSLSARHIARAAAERFGEDSRPAAIVLTHGHFDHVGSLRDLADRWEVPVFAHELEMPYLTGRSSYPPPDPSVGGGLMALMSPLYSRGPIDIRDRVRSLPADGSVPFMPGWRWVHTPGHTPGHVSFFRDADRTLIVGDAFVTQKQESMLGVLTQRQGVHPPPAYFTQDWQAAHSSIQRIADLNPEVAATGHGVPLRGEMLRQQLTGLLKNWERRIPQYGRYIRLPAVADQSGTMSVPPPVFNHRLLAMAGVALAGVVAGVAWATSASESE